MIQFALYGKGGIGKSTVASNVSAALAESGLTVLQIGCDPKADSTAALTGGVRRPTAMELLRERGKDYPLDALLTRGYAGVLCMEAGGPPPGLGCAGRAITSALEALRDRGAYELYRPDVVIYDVLGDVVCGGFSVPMREGYAQSVFVVTSGENMSLHAAANIALAVENFKSRGYARLGGIILNRRNVKLEDEKVAELCADLSTELTGALPRSAIVQEAEELGKTVVEAFPESGMAGEYRSLAQRILEAARKGESACS